MRIRRNIQGVRKIPKVRRHLALSDDKGAKSWTKEKNNSRYREKKTPEPSDLRPVSLPGQKIISLENIGKENRKSS